MSELVAAFEKGDHARAREINASLFPSYEYESRETAQFALAVKVAIRNLGLPAGPCRLPIGPEPDALDDEARAVLRSEEHTSELQSLMRISYSVFCWKKKTRTKVSK